MLFVELLVQGVIGGAIYALVAVGLTLVYGLLRILHVAHAGLFTLGAYLGVVLTNATGSLLLAMAVAVLAVGTLGMAVYKLIYEPLLARPPFVTLIASIGLFICMEELFRLGFGPYGESFAAVPLWDPVALAGISIRQVELVSVVLAIGLLSGLGVLAARSRMGLAWRASVTDPAMAASFGVDIAQVRYANFFVGSALAAVAGCLLAVLNNFVEPTMGSVPSYKALAIIVLGGLGSVRGTLVASLALGVIEAFGTIYLGTVLDRDAIAFAFLILVLMVRPQGLFGRT